VEGREDKIEAIRKCIITRWPSNLIIQLQRWDFRIEAGEKLKLVHEFGFPTHLSSKDVIKNCDVDKEYELSAVICHIGDAESGHYTAIYKDDDKWHCCDDESVTPFDIGSLAAQEFGISEGDSELAEEVRTAYLLFYRQNDSSKEKAGMPDDLRMKIDRMNELKSPCTFFFSLEFLNFSFELCSMESRKDAAILSFIVFFRISFVDVEQTRKWSELILSGLQE
jgi:hypothetical protein